MADVTQQEIEAAALAKRIESHMRDAALHGEGHVFDLMPDEQPVVIAALLAAAQCRAPGEDTVAALVERFLAWPLPKSVCSDMCVTNSNYEFPRSGTCLLTADQARQMIEYLLAHPLPSPPKDGE